MNATATPIEEKELRTPDGKFRNRAGPGRPSKRIKALRERYKGATETQTLELLAADVAKLEAELQAADADIEAVEVEIVERSAPLIRHREEVACTLARARVAQAFLADRIGFSGGQSVIQQAKLDHDEAVARLADARANLAANPDPNCGRLAALADADKWKQLHAFESARDAVRVAESEEYQTRQRAISLGVAADDPTLKAAGMMPGDDGFDVVPSRRGMGEL